MTRWRYPHADFDEAPFPDGPRVLRPAVRIATTGRTRFATGMIDSGSPITIASPGLLSDCGVDIQAPPIMTVPLRLGSAAGEVTVHRVELELGEPPPGDGRVRWAALVASRSPWIFRFDVLLGVRGWFDRFATTIDATHTTVDLGAVSTVRAAGS